MCVCVWLCVWLCVAVCVVVLLHVRLWLTPGCVGASQWLSVGALSLQTPESIGALLSAAGSLLNRVRRPSDVAVLNVAVVDLALRVLCVCAAVCVLWRGRTTDASPFGLASLCRCVVSWMAYGGHLRWTANHIQPDRPPVHHNHHRYHPPLVSDAQPLRPHRHLQLQRRPRPRLPPCCRRVWEACGSPGRAVW